MGFFDSFIILFTTSDIDQVAIKHSAITEPIVKVAKAKVDNMVLKTAELKKLTKKALDVHASTVHGIQLDGRQTKDNMIKELNKELKGKK